ncbi:hypothetical protein [Jiella pelagia]|uniref:Uncharacterized protein n=1 Tax=Jiella pelagia TaxID=2986949 RepID=A0ABY7BWN9_9HYPH|nr:hypothetical protein [Jiella pelagia]WAP67356.1 hypothetical protein OH818_17625 [Jiella pelagia]
MSAADSTAAGPASGEAMAISAPGDQRRKMSSRRATSASPALRWSGLTS